MSKNRDILIEGSKQLGVSLSPEPLEKLLRYLDLIIKWNKVYNLTAIRNLEDMVRLHLLDSLAIAPVVFSGERKTIKRLIDVGTGAGLPGVVLAILEPKIDVSLLDTNGKKCRFLQQVKIELGLKNIDVIHHRVETLQPERRYDAVLSRAFATLKDMTDNAHHLLSDNGVFLAMKGRYPDQELGELDSEFSFLKAHPLQIPGLDVERYLVEIAGHS